MPARTEPEITTAPVSTPAPTPVPAPVSGSRWWSRWPVLAGCLAALWSLLYGAASLYWALGGSGYPFAATVTDRSSASLLEPSSPDVVGYAIAAVGAAGTVAGLLMARGRVRGRARGGLLGFGWVTACVLALLLPDYSLLADMRATPGMLEIGLGLAVASTAGGLLTRGLIGRWGEVWPRWVWWKAGKPVRPATAIVPATTVALVLIPAGLMNIRLFDSAMWGTNGPGVFWTTWGVALGAATLAFYFRRRGQCAQCGRVSETVV
ncbi:hypothetical protein [Streptomyces sp. NPDC017529]|uniref:hypothetical protein n=1 Tax=Streptomyces sp. NPDC017529 TaxID=3365000 RepID=UPI003798B12E